MVIVTTLKLMTPYVRKFEDFCKAMDYLYDLDYFDEELKAMKGVGVIELDDVPDFLIGFTGLGRLHKVEFADWPEDTTDVDDAGYLLQAAEVYPL